MATEKAQIEGKSVEVSAEVPTPTFTETETQPLAGNDLKSLQASLETFQAEIRGQLKALQSDKDKRIPKLEGSLQDLMSEITRLKGHGFTDDEAVNEVEFRQNVKELAQKMKGIEQSAQPVGSGTSGAGQEAQRIIEELKLNTGDPDVLQWAGGKYRNPDHMRAEAALLVARKLSKPAPSSAASPPMTGGGVSSELSDADKEIKLAQLQKLYKTPTIKATEIKVLEKELGME
jgi:hypothetical protein